MKLYVSKIHELEGELLRLKNLSRSKQRQFIDYVDSDDERVGLKNGLFPSLNSSNSDTKAADVSGNMHFVG